MSKYLFNWDAAQFALGTEQFLLNAHQPHPPGYLFYIYLGKLLNLSIGDINASFIVINIVFSAFTVMLAFYFFMRILRGRKLLSVLASLMLMCVPLFWFYGEIANTYAFDAFFSILIGWLAYEVLMKNFKVLPWLGLALGLSGGFRPSLIILFLPIGLLALIFAFAKKKWKPSVIAIVLGILGLCAWLIPTVMLSGGFQAYYNDTKAIMDLSASVTSILKGAPFSEFIILVKTMSSVLATYTAILVLALIIALLAKRRFKISNRLSILFVILWIAPSILMYTLGHLGQIGYLLTLIPPLIVILVWLTARTKAYSLLAVFLIIGIILGATTFIFGDFSQPILDKVNCKLKDSTAVQSIGYWNDRFSAPKIEEQDRYAGEVIDYVEENFNPEEAVIVTRWGRTSESVADERGEMKFEPLSFRLASYYLSKFKVYQIRSDFKPAYLQTQNHEPIKPAEESFDIDLDPNVKNVVFIDNGIDPSTELQYSFEMIELDDGRPIYVTGAIPVKYLGYTFN